VEHDNFSILYVEDDILIRSRYQKLLKLHFKNVYEAANGKEALSIYNEKRPDVIILDINIPLINGLNVAKKIRETDDQIKIIFFTAYSEKEKLLQAIDLRAVKYLIKPIKTFELEELITILIEELRKESSCANIIDLECGFYWDKSVDTLFDKDDKSVKLTKKETLLIKLFCQNKQKIFTTGEILDYVWEDDFDDLNTNKLRILLSKLKTKLSCSLFSSHYNLGYKINVKEG
jgi:DNA-binding response OmpR family regulator